MQMINVVVSWCIVGSMFLVDKSLGNNYPWLDQIVRQEKLSIGCEKLNLRKNTFDTNQLNHILVDHKHKLLYCYVPKVACTNWKRVFMVLTDQSNCTNLMDIPATIAHAENSTIRLSQLSPKEINTCLQEYTTFLLVRNPFERLVSAYRNKFCDTYSSSRYFQARYGRHIIKTYRVNPSKSALKSGSDVTFPEFVRYLLNEGVQGNEHWTPIFNLCHPCTFNYTLIGHYETLIEDTKTVLDMVGAEAIRFPSTRTAHTKEKVKSHFQQISLMEIRQLYSLYENDFRLFGYNLEDILGYDLA